MAVESTLQTYLEEINESPLLNAQEEKDLAYRIRQGDQEARNRMISSNLRLVVNIAKKFANRGMPLADLIEEGNLGLIRAVEDFDPEQGSRFSTYASWWIKQSIKRALINAVQPIHIPAYMVEMINRWRQVNRDLRDKYNHTPTLMEISEAMGEPLRKVKIIRRAVKAFSSPSQMPESDNKVALTESLQDNKNLQPDEIYHKIDDIKTVMKLLKEIDPREAEVLRLRFGLKEGKEPMTLKEIGKEIGLTRERVRQIEKEALEKLNQILTADD